MARRRNRIKVTIEQDVTAKLGQVRTGLRSKAVSQAMHAGAALMGAAAQAAAPAGDTGMLRAGVFVSSAYRDNFKALRRPRNGQSLNDPLRNPPRPGQALVRSSVFYTRFVEGGKKGRTGVARSARKWRGLGYQRKRPFFMRTIRRVKPQALALAQRHLVRLIEEAWQR